MSCYAILGVEVPTCSEQGTTGKVQSLSNDLYRDREGRSELSNSPGVLFCSFDVVPNITSIQRRVFNSQLANSSRRPKASELELEGYKVPVPSYQAGGS